jgi:hypothetical protein
VRPIYDPQLPPLRQALQNYVAGRFPLPFRLQTMYRIFKNRFRKLISRRFWMYLQFLSSTLLSRENPSRKLRYRSERFCCGRNRFLARQNLLDQCRHFLDEFSQLRMVLDRNERYVQNRLEISFLDLFLKILYVVCSPNNNRKRLSTKFFGE